MSGFYLMHRGWLDNPVLDGDPYCKRAAWAWLVENARWQDGQARMLGKIISLRRGQLTFATRYMGTAWGWSEAKVRRFLRELQGQGMIEINSDGGQTLLTICNYDDYQVSVCNGDAPMTQERRASDANKNEPLRESYITPREHELDQVASAPPEESRRPKQPQLALEPSVEESGQGSLLPSAKVVRIENNETRFAEFYAAYPRKIDPDDARKAYLKAIKVASHDEIMEGLRRYEFSPEKKFRPHPATWLNKQRWRTQADEDSDAGDAPLSSAAAPKRTRQGAETAPVNDPQGIEAWCRSVPGVRPTESETERRYGRWKNADGILDYWARRVIEAAGFGSGWRGDLNPILDWMKSDLGADEAAEIIAERVGRHRARGGDAIVSLRFFGDLTHRRGAA